MRPKTLIELAGSTQRYLTVEHPEVSLSDDGVEVKLASLYRRLMQDVGRVDAHLIRHRTIEQIASLELVMEIERIGLFSGFCLHIEQDRGMIAQWIEKETIFD